MPVTETSFSPSAFDLDEPTMHIRPSGETELVTESNGNSSVDMSLDSSDDSGLQSEEEASMEMTAVLDDASSVELQQSFSDDSAMDLTVAHGGLVGSNTTMLPSGEEEGADDSESEQESSSDVGRDGGDRTVTMQFTDVYGTAGDEEEEDEEEDEEVDMQLTEVDSASERGEEADDDSAMDLTEVYSQSLVAATPTITRRESATHTTRRLSSPKRKDDNPRLGHEFCRIPAADSPVSHVSVATAKLQARRQNTSLSPVKTAQPARKSLSVPATSPLKKPFSSSSSAARPPGHAVRASLPSPATPSRASLSQPRLSSPAKTPTTPSHVWQSFRDGTRPSEGEPMRSPARRLSIEPGSPSRSTFGSPQRIVVPQRRHSARPHDQPINEEDTGRQEATSERWTMKQFFDSLDLGFLELTMPTKRRVERAGSAEGRASTAAIIKAACAQIPFLESLVEVCKELKETVEGDHHLMSDLDKAFCEHPPAYVAEVLAMTSVAERQQAVSSFRIQKSAARAIALKAYYGWRTDKQFGEDTLQKWEDVRSKLEEDKRLVREMADVVRKQALPVLTERHRELTEEVAREQARQRAIESSDDDEMRELHRALEEQGSVLEEQQARHAEARDQLASLQRRLDEMAAKRTATEDAIDKARMASDAIRTCTKAEATRLARQIKHLETLHLWTLHRASLDEIVMGLEQTLMLRMQLGKAAVKGAQVQVDGSTVWEGALQAALDGRMSLLQGSAQPADIVRFLSTAWTRVRHLTAIYDALLARFPARMDMDGEEGFAVVCVAVLLPRRKSKVVVEARCALARLLDCSAPLFAPDDISAHCVYGAVDAPALAAQIADCVTLGSSAGDLTMAIVEALETFD